MSSRKETEEQFRKLGTRQLPSPNFFAALIPPQERSVEETLLLASVSEALSSAMRQITSQTEKRVAIQEFWHSLNRKGIIRNDEVDTLISLSILESSRR